MFELGDEDGANDRDAERSAELAQDRAIQAERLAALLARPSSRTTFHPSIAVQGGQPPADQPAPDAVADAVRDYIASLPVAEFPNMVALADQFALVDQDHRFELLLDLYVDGLARRAERS